MEPLTKHVRELAQLDAKSAPKRRLAILQVRAGGAGDPAGVQGGTGDPAGAQGGLVILQVRKRACSDARGHW